MPKCLNNLCRGPTPYNYVSIAGTNLNLGDDSVAQLASPFSIAFRWMRFISWQVEVTGN